MFLERIYDEDLSQASYFLGCQNTGQAIVIDPRRDVGCYLELAAKQNMEIVAVTETHIHADYLSGTRELASATGAAMYVSGHGGKDWSYRFEAHLLGDADTLNIGTLRIQAVHTPGHTPEHLMFLVTDTTFSDKPGYAFTGDFVFAGDVGRPDLLDEAAGEKDTRFAAAAQLFASLKRSFVTLPGYVQVFPAHGAGSACGKALGALPSSSVGYESDNAWWAPYVRKNDVEGFTAQLLDGQPDAHAYFGRMKRHNRDGAALANQREQVTEIPATRAKEMLAQGEAVFIDTRSVDKVHAGMVPGALHVPYPGKPAGHTAWVYDPERESTKIIVLARDAESATDFRDALLRVGIDTLEGFVTELPAEPGELVVPETITVQQFAERPIGAGTAETQQAGVDIAGAFVLDVRTKNEHAAGHIPGSKQLSAGRVLWHLDKLPVDQLLVTYCQMGLRNAIAASALRRAGYRVIELSGSYAAWERAGIPPATGHEGELV